MSIPSRKQQIEAVCRWLDSEANEGRDLHDIATDVVDGFHSLLKGGIKQEVPTPHVGLAFKSPFDGKTRHIAWMSGERVWVVSSDSRFGAFWPTSSDAWSYVEESRAKAGAPGNNPKWSVGDRVLRSQGMNRYEVIATGDKCVLLRDRRDWEVLPESNDNMALYYQRELFE